MDPEKAKDIRTTNNCRKSIDRLIQYSRENQTNIFNMSVFPAIASVIIGLSNAVCCLFVTAIAYFGAFGVGSYYTTQLLWQ